MELDALYQDTLFSCHYTNFRCTSLLSDTITREVTPRRSEHILVYLCIGTDRATGDCLGPLTGTRFKILCPSAHILGTLEEPLHALNLEENLASIKNRYENPILIAVDASLGTYEKIGVIGFKSGGVRPGSALNKNLPIVGDYNITGIVNVGGFCEHLVLQNTRLSLVYKMAETISRALFLAHRRTHSNPRETRILQGRHLDTSAKTI